MGTAFFRSGGFFFLPVLIFGAGVGVATAGPGEAGPAPKGEGEISVRCGRDVLRVFTYKSPQFSTGPVFFVFHGMRRNAEEYRNYAIPLAKERRGMVAAPLFDAERFPASSYARPNLAQPDHSLAVACELIRTVLVREGNPRREHYLIGHSAGGQLVSRWAAVEPVTARRILAANPGTFAFPRTDWDWAYGLGGMPGPFTGEKNLRRYLAAPLTILLGQADTDNSAEVGNLDGSPEANRQGINRLERGRKFFEAGRALAKEKGWKFGWEKVEIPGIGHDGKLMINDLASQKALR